MPITFSQKYERIKRDKELMANSTRRELPVKTQPWWDGMPRSGKIDADDKLTVHYYTAGSMESETFPDIDSLVEKWSVD